ncbi:GNAT family N-acetyltransferase [Treponema sp.]|uniref:GNAT family N-acetyltransferase n=1 Tax=Treponema sp. TaxID=166 RepID=UPI00298EA77A|nr:GNAT family N-acetyltransferase [Treponema sp.]
MKNKMEIIEFFTCDNQDHWLSEIKKSDWEAAQLLYELLSKGTFKDTVGVASLVFLLTDGDSLVSFCTFSTFDDVQPTDLTPWIGFVYTFPEYRGHHYVGRLIEHIENIATAMEKEYIYISTDKDGLYEKYGYDFFKFLKDIHGEDSRIYRKKLSADDGTKEERKTLGAVAKSKIIETAKASCLDMTAPCGFISTNPVPQTNNRPLGRHNPCGPPTDIGRQTEKNPCGIPRTDKGPHPSKFLWNSFSYLYNCKFDR